MIAVSWTFLLLFEWRLPWPLAGLSYKINFLRAGGFSWLKSRPFSFFKLLLSLKFVILIPSVSEGLVTGRGCSTKRSSYKKCETHSYGKISQKFCYCKKTMCNPSTMVLPTSILTLSTSILLTPALLSIASSFSTISILTMISLFSTVSGVIQRIPGLFGVIMRYRRKRRRRPDPELWIPQIQ